MKHCTVYTCSPKTDKDMHKYTNTRVPVLYNVPPSIHDLHENTTDPSAQKHTHTTQKVL